MMTDTHEPIIEVENLVVRYGEHTVLDGVTFQVRRGEVFVILGGSGSGKTTLLRNLVGLMRPDSGRILIKGEDFTSMNGDDRIELRKKIGMCFQGSALLNSISVGENVALPLREHTKLEDSTIEIMTKIKLELVGLGGVEDYLPSELSGGMKKRAGIARAMAMDPEIIFYDEPSAGLDPIVGAGIDVLIRKMQETFQLSSVVVTHEMESVKAIADTVCMLQGGRVVGIGSLEELERADHPYIQQFFARRPYDEEAEDSAYARALTGLD
ncbi:MAG: ABC transporter ATP-binding protein [Thermoanaerobaculales bacterium]|nr:ABC transporter ATP-binding protein [Thermoanaerobaculales bacterium]